MKTEPMPWEPTMKELALTEGGLKAKADKLNEKLMRERMEYAESIARGEQPNGAAAEYVKSENLGKSRT